jgi:predicted phage tail protein
MEKEIRLYGPLAKFIGQRKFLAEISSAGEAIRMLLANFPGLERHMADQHYKVIVDGLDAEVSEIHFPFSQTIKIVPVLGGAGGGVGRIIAGVALVAIALINPFGAAAIGTFGGTPIAVASLMPAIGAIGASLILGGVAQLLSPTPQLGQIGPASMGGGRTTTTEGTEMDPQESYSFSGIQNTSRQGTPVPVVYGETIVGSVVISAGIDVDTI